MTDAERRVRRWSARVRRSLAERDAAIQDMRSEGATLRAIADAAQLTHAGVARIVKRESTVELVRQAEEFGARLQRSMEAAARGEVLRFPSGHFEKLAEDLGPDED